MWLVWTIKKPGSLTATFLIGELQNVLLFRYGNGQLHITHWCWSICFCLCLSLLSIPYYTEASVIHLRPTCHSSHFSPHLPLSHSYLSPSQCCSWTEYGKTATHAIHLRHSLRLRHPCRCLMRVQAQKSEQRWIRAWKARIGRSIKVYFKNCPPFQSLHQAVLHT